MNITWKGTNSNTITGLLICELPPISKPKMRTNIIKIDGKDGEIVEELGYESYTKNIKIGLTKNFDIDTVIKYFTGSGTLVMSNEPNRVYNARIIDRIDYEKLLRFKTAVVKFYTEPYKYLNNESVIDRNTTSLSSVTVTNAGKEISKPVITLYGSGTVTIAVNGSTIFTYTFPSGESEVVIDSIKEEAYLSGVYKNRNMNGEYPKLIVGNNTITWTGSLTRIKVEPKSRWI